MFLANQGLTSDSEAIDAELVKDWRARVGPRVWTLLDFNTEPGLLTVQLAVSLARSSASEGRDARALRVGGRRFRCHRPDARVAVMTRARRQQATAMRSVSAAPTGGRYYSSGRLPAASAASARTRPRWA